MLSSSLRIIAGAAVIALGVFLGSPAQACGWAWEVSCQDATTANNGTFDFAVIFSVPDKEAITIDHLGFSAAGGGNNNPVTLYRCNDAECSWGVPIADAIIGASDPVSHNFRWRAIPTQLLGPGAYEVAGVSAGDNYVENATIVFTRQVTVQGEYWAALSTPELLNATNAPIYGASYAAYPAF